MPTEPFRHPFLEPSQPPRPTPELPQILAALDTCNELYFDRVSQIRMDAWSHGSVALVGDAAFCVSLLAGQGSALAMTAAYVLAGELATSQDRPQEAFRRYEERLRRFIRAKQQAAERFAAAFVPRTRLGVFFRNQCEPAPKWDPALPRL